VEHLGHWPVDHLRDLELYGHFFPLSLDLALTPPTRRWA
jgi:hypothetical protein